MKRIKREKFRRMAFLLLFPVLLYGGMRCSEDRITDLSVKPSPSVTEVTAGGSGYVTLRMLIPLGHHIYGNPLGPGVGKPTLVSVKAPDALRFEPARFLPAKRYTPPGLKDYVWIYEGGTNLFLPFQALKAAVPGDYTVLVQVETLLCSEKACIPRDFQLEHKIKVLPAGTKQSFADNESVSEFLRSRPPGFLGAALNEDSRKTVSEGRQGWEFKPQCIASNNISGILQAVFFGILAGLILNFMPCVLPVVSLKIVGFIRNAGEDKKVVLRTSLLFTLGILTIFIVLAALAAFLGYKWGELFQKRWFLIAMIGVVFAMSLSLFGVFSINIPSFIGRMAGQRSNLYLDAYVKGLLATLLATPCSGPFLGGTLAWSLLQPPLVIFLIFFSVGLGMSLPYLIIALRPGLIRFIPKPGGWTITLEQIMGFLLVGTAVYLIGILERDYVVPTLWFLLFLGLGLWQYGRYGAPTEPPGRRALSALMLVILLAGGSWVSYSLLFRKSDAAVNRESKNFSLAELEKVSRQGGISAVKFTADWCPNCKLVENTSLYTGAVQKRMRDMGATLFEADMTRNNPDAEWLLKRLGSRSIPFLVLFPPGKDFFRPYCLRDIYTEEDVLEALKRVMGENPEVKAEDIKFQP